MKLQELFTEFERVLRNQNNSGWDPFDALTSKLLKKTPFYKSKICRLIWIQFFKRCPVNLRKIAMVSKGYNSKGLALFIRGMLNIYEQTNSGNYLDEAVRMAEIILSQRATNRPYFCIGYPFFWQARAFTVEAFTPNMVVSCFVGQAFLDLYKITGDDKWLKYVLDIGKFIEEELLLGESGNQICFGYIPGEATKIHNANLLGAALFARMFSITGEPMYKKYAEKAVEYSIKAQREDGSWSYGEAPKHQWADNFHTGFNLTALEEIQKYLISKRWQKNIDLGLKYHLTHHFTDEMLPRFLDTRTYPLDIHNFAQGIITLLTFNYNKDANILFQNSLKLMWSRKKHYFYYQKNRLYTNRINYLRWSQAWMFWALSKLLSQ